jgi:hypothetical protein
MPIIKTVLACSISAFLVINSSCTTGMERAMEDQCHVWANSFFRKPIDERIAQFSGYDIDSQYSIFICGNQFIEPPAIYLAGPFALEGRKVVALLRKKLLETKHDPTIRDIVLVFREMSRQGSYDVASDTDLMKLMADKVAGIEDADWRRITRQMVSEIAGTHIKAREHP